ncbi:MAG TPA: hypothetical protein VKP88_06140, partial [Candidatus Paceibacterota bacterium]|nr:hypothetical protein [Candidatus Paceibacterota bacterium]
AASALGPGPPDLAHRKVSPVLEVKSGKRDCRRSPDSASESSRLALTETILRTGAEREYDDNPVPIRFVSPAAISSRRRGLPSYPAPAGLPFID